jgi:RES domain-containing protein
MRLWRISNYADLTGAGGLHNSGRWHSSGTEIVYLAETPASALLERMVHLEINADELPSHYQLLAVDIADDVAFETVDERKLPKNWRSEDAATQPTGDRWLKENRTALLRVPSAIVPHTSNWLLNPNHPDAAKARIVLVDRTPFDKRLFR